MEQSKVSHSWRLRWGWRRVECLVWHGKLRYKDRRKIVLNISPMPCIIILTCTAKEPSVQHVFFVFHKVKSKVKLIWGIQSISSSGTYAQIKNKIPLVEDLLFLLHFKRHMSRWWSLLPFFPPCVHEKNKCIYFLNVLYFFLFSLVHIFPGDMPCIPLSF